MNDPARSVLARSTVIRKQAAKPKLFYGPLMIGLVVLLLSGCGSSGPGDGSASKVEVALRRQAPDGRLALLEIDPFQVGPNTFHVRVMDQNATPADASSVGLRFSNPEDNSGATELPATSETGGTTFTAEHELQRTGWWGIDVVLDGSWTINFYVRLDTPSHAPLEFAPADYASDPNAEALFRRTLDQYQGLSSMKEREELTSGLLAPTGIGAWILTQAQFEAPDRVLFAVLSPGGSRYETYRVRDRSCTHDLDTESWQCTKIESSKAFDLAFMTRATAFRLGREELIDGESSQVLFFYNPSQRAWFAWWVGKETGYLRQQAMVAPGHFMVTKYYDHNVPISLDIPPEASAAEAASN